MIKYVKYKESILNGSIYKALYEFQQTALNCLTTENSEEDKINKIQHLLKSYSSNISIKINGAQNEYNSSIALYSRKFKSIFLKML